MTGSQNQPSNRQSRSAKEIVDLLGTVVGLITAVPLLIGLLDDKAAILIIGAAGAIFFGARAILAGRKGDKNHGWWWIIAVVMVIATLIYGLWPEAAKGDSSQQTNGRTDSTKEQPPPPRTSTSPAPRTQETPPSPESTGSTEKPPEFEGSANIILDYQTSYTLNLDVPNAKPKATNDIAETDDVRINKLGFIYDGKGKYLLSLGISDSADYESCKKLLSSNKPRQAVFVLPNFRYCVLTSEGRIALIQFGEGQHIGRVGNLSYQVWSK